MDASNKTANNLVFSDASPAAIFSNFNQSHSVALPNHYASNLSDLPPTRQINLSTYESLSFTQDHYFNAEHPNFPLFQSEPGTHDLQSLSLQFFSLLNWNLKFSKTNTEVPKKSKRKPKSVFNVIKKEYLPEKTLCTPRTCSDEEVTPGNTTSLDLDGTPSSNKASVSSKKYFTHSQNQKREILDYFEVNGFDKTLEKFGKQDPNLTLKKLKSWQLNIDKVKNNKGKQSTDPARNKALLEWYNSFKMEQGKLPTSKELKEKALELSNDSEFIASKGWLDKFRKKYKIDLHLLKVKGSRKQKDLATCQEEQEAFPSLHLEEFNIHDTSIDMGDTLTTQDFIQPNSTTVPPQASFDLTEDYRCSIELDSLIASKNGLNHNTSFEIQMNENDNLFSGDFFTEADLLQNYNISSYR